MRSLGDANLCGFEETVTGERETQRKGEGEGEGGGGTEDEER